MVGKDNNKELIMILITGAAGQLGADIARELSERGIAYMGADINGQGMIKLDIARPEAVRDCLLKHKPRCVIHCAAYTAVDKAEDEPELCMSVNAAGTEALASICREIDAKLLYISTDYVFGGEGLTPYETDSPKTPLSVYGRSKLLGEEAVMRHISKFYIVRTSWVFGGEGSNFVNTMLRLAKTNSEINVVGDQIGSPTYTADLAALLCDMALSERYGVYHATNEGFCSWAEFAGEIMRLAGSKCKVNPISTEQYPTKAIRPKNSRLSKASLDIAGFARLQQWQDALKQQRSCVTRSKPYLNDAI